MQDLDHLLKEEIARVRQIILGADERSTGQIRWNAPSCCFEGEDRVTLRLQPHDRLQLIFHRGAQVRDSTKFAFEDTTGLLHWITSERARVAFSSLQEIAAQEAALTAVVAR